MNLIPARVIDCCVKSLLLIFLIAPNLLAALPKVETVTGQAEMKKPSQSEWVVLAKGSEISEGSRIRTKIGSRLGIRIENGSILTLKENSIFEVIKSRNGQYDFRLWIGELRSQINKLRPRDDFRVRTPVAVAGIRGTDFMLRTEQSGRTDISVYEGSVEFRSSLRPQQVLVGAAQSATVSEEGQLSELRKGVTRLDEEDLASLLSPTTGDTSRFLDAPLIISAPLEGAVLSARTSTVLGSAAPGATVTVNGVPAVADVSGRFSVPVVLVDGVNVIAVAAGSQQRSVMVTVDSRRPSISVAPFRDLTNIPSISLTVTTKEGAVVSALGVSAVASGGIANFQIGLTEGDNVITIRAVDAQGLSAEQTVRIVLDTLKPNIMITSVTPTAGGIRAAGLTEPRAIVTVNGYPMEIRSDGSFDQLLAGLTAAEVTFEARDLAGNVSREVRNAAGTVDNAPPSLVSLNFTPPTIEGGGAVNVMMAVQDVSEVAQRLELSLTGPSGATLSSTLIASGRIYSGILTVPVTAANGSYSPGAITLADILGNTATVTPSTTLLVSNAAPSPPASISASDATTGGRVTVTWSAVSASDLADYTLSSGPSGSGPWMPVYTGSATSQTVIGLVNGSAYYYVVTARDIGGNVSSPSAVASVTPTDQVPPSTPSGLSAAATSSTSIQLSWSASADAANYKVYRSLSAGGGAPWAQIGTSAGTSFTASGLTTATAYFFSVTALDNNTSPPSGAPNESAVGSNSASATTP